MDTRRLAIFLEVVEQGGFTRAADTLDIAQPSVSQAVRELEAALGTSLFHRLGRSISLTPAGEALVAPARQVRRDLENGLASVEEVTGLGRGRLDIACLPTLAVARSPRSSERFGRPTPKSRSCCPTHEIPQS